MKILFFYSLEGWDLCAENLRDLLSTSSPTSYSIDEMAGLLEHFPEGAYINQGEGFMAFILSAPFPPPIGCTFRVNTFVDSELFMEDLVVCSIDLLKSNGSSEYVFFLTDQD